MTQIASIDWDLQRFYLHVDTVTSGFDAWLAFAEVRQTIQLNANNEQGYSLFIHRKGKAPKDGVRFTPKFVSFNAGWRAVPYSGVSHELSIHTEMISDDLLVDKDMFDRSTVAVEVDIDSVYEQVEIITIAGGTGLDAGQDAKLTRVHALLDVIENGLDHAEIMKILLAGMAGKVSGAETATIVFRDNADSKARITATTDGQGNRTAITLDAS